MGVIDNFSGKNFFLSNYYMAPVSYDGDMYPSNEHAFQAAKVKNKKDREPFKYYKTPDNAKRAGRSVKLRKDWEDIKIQVMTDICIDKFRRNPELKQKLLDTSDDLLIEGNTWNDKFWGVCGGEGQNNLGTILEHVRELLKSEE